MKKLLMFIVAMIICNAYGESVTYLSDNTEWETTACDSGGNISMPTKGTPTKTGFRFIGWREASSLSEVCILAGTTSTPISTDTGRSYWSSTFSWGTVTGEIRCSSSGGGSTCFNGMSDVCSTSSNPSTSGTRKYCWCKMTDAGPFNSTTNLSSLSWVYLYDAGSNCSLYCAYNCGRYVKENFRFRRGIFGLQ